MYHMHDTQNKKNLKIFDGTALDSCKMAGEVNFIVIENEKSLLSNGGIGLL